MAAFLFALCCAAQWPVDGGQWSASAYNLATPTTEAGRFYPETGQTLAPQFVSYFDRNGGLPLFGYPITETRREGGYLVQWTQRERLEWHPENAGTAYEVLLGLLGRELTGDLRGPEFNRQPAVSSRQEATVVKGDCQPPTADCRLPIAYFPETGHTLAEPFASYWQRNGGLAVFGYPISEPFSDDMGLRVQWFERARFEYHPELPPAFVVSLGLVGVEAQDRAGLETYEFRVINSPAGAGHLQLGLSQGGESDDPGFFDNVRSPASDLGPGLVRLDNIFNFYNVVSRSPSGTLEYRWDRLDRVVDGIRAMGKEPFICLSYMPETVSASRSSRVQPPGDFGEWGQLVRATVLHLNVERKLGIRYWEVWNEPNQWDFWKGSFEDYLRLYDVTAAAVISADNKALVGGPAFSSFEPMGISQFLQHEASLGEGGRVNFLSWHAYGRSQAEMAAQIREAREMVSRYPGLHPELFVTEFNVSPGGPGDTSAYEETDTVQGAIELLRSVESMERERLDRALLFELKDGRGPASYWGRWGVLTNDGRAKPIYYALMAYQKRPGAALPVVMTKGPGDDTLGLMAFGGAARSTLLLWYTGKKAARVHVALPPEFEGVDYEITLFDRSHNNPARSGDSTVRPWLRRNAGDLALDLSPGSLVVLTSIDTGR
ncbi:MAG: GH39 family glycosyl hydrolase [Chloroflexia bacterium]